MHQIFEITRTSRKVLSQFLQQYSIEQLNKIPDGYNNNVIWNIGHIVVVQQMLVYKLSGLPMVVSDEFVEKYKKGTRPEATILQPEIDALQSLLFDTINQTKADFNSGVFRTYQEFTSMSGFTMKNVEDAMAFNYYHEGVHTGMMMGIRKFI